MKKVYLSLGSNIGDRGNYLTKATKRLNGHPEITVVQTSSVYETAAWGIKDQADFYNIAAEIGTSLMPMDLLAVCQGIETELERTRVQPWGPRTVDIDILLYEDVELTGEFLTIPHKYLLERSFVTIPLTEIAPDLWVKGVRISTVAKEHTRLGDRCLKTEYQIKIE